MNSEVKRMRRSAECFLYRYDLDQEPYQRGAILPLTFKRICGSLQHVGGYSGKVGPEETAYQTKQIASVSNI